MKKYNNIIYHSVSMSEFQKVLSEISDKSELVMKQFTFVECEDLNPHFRIEFCNFEDVNCNICIYVDFPTKVKVDPFEVICKMELLYTDLKRFGFRHCYPSFETKKCDTNEHPDPMS